MVYVNFVQFVALAGSPFISLTGGHWDLGRAMAVPQRRVGSCREHSIATEPSPVFLGVYGIVILTAVIILLFRKFSLKNTLLRQLRRKRSRRRPPPFNAVDWLVVLLLHDYLIL
jgi:hypothetical protein